MPTRDLFSQLPDDSPPPPAVEPQVLSVAELTARIKDLLEGYFGSVWVAGEISNLARPQSGHCYLTLKDDEAQIRSAMRRNAAMRAALRLARRFGSRLRRADRCLWSAGHVPVDHRDHRAEGDWGPGIGLAAASREVGQGRAVRPAAEAAVAAVRAADCGGHQPHRRGDPRFPPGARAAMAGGRRNRGPHAGAGRGRGRRNRRSHRHGQRLAAGHRLPGRHPRRRQPGRPLGLQRGSGGAGDPRLADSRDLGHRPRDRCHAGRSGGRRSAP